MGVIKFNISKTEGEWNKINELSKGKPSHFIYSELMKLYGKEDAELFCLPCLEKCVAPMKIKYFELNLNEDMERKVKCAAKILNLEPGQLIARFISDPNLK